MRWDVEPREGGASVAFRHGTFPDEDAGSVAYTWGQIMVALKRYVETDVADPVFT